MWFLGGCSAVWQMYSPPSWGWTLRIWRLQFCKEYWSAWPWPSNFYSPCWALAWQCWPYCPLCRCCPPQSAASAHCQQGISWTSWSETIYINFSAKLDKIYFEMLLWNALQYHLEKYKLAIIKMINSVQQDIVSLRFRLSSAWLIFLTLLFSFFLLVQLI